MISRDGKLYPVPFSPGITTVGDLRAVVAEHMSAAPETVRNLLLCTAAASKAKLARSF